MILRKKEEGSIAVEASLIMPIFLCFVVFLITLIRISIVEITLNSAVSEATKQISTHMYPIDLLFDRFSDTETGKKANEITDKVQEIRQQIIDVENIANEYAPLFPPEIRELIGIRDSFETGVIGTYDSAMGRAFQPIVDHFVDDQIIQLEHLQVTKVTLPNLKDRDQMYFGLTVRYDMPLHIPFVNMIITFKQQAFERVWIGVSRKEVATTPDSPQSDDEPEDSKEPKETEEPEKTAEPEELYIDSISSPVQRGKKVRIIAKGSPGEVATIELKYKSGFQKQQSCQFDSNGWLLCDIKIGGNANEGIYQAIVTVEEQKVSGAFEVMSKESIKQYTSDRKKSVNDRK
jgi:hypothetical protein